MIEGQGGRPFSEWLRAQLRAKRMSQRQLAVQSGVDHSTISRLIRGDRTPSLDTATKLARGLRELREEQEPTQYLRMIQAPRTNPVARVEYALRGDEAMTEEDVHEIMEAYLAVRVSRLRRAAVRAVDPVSVMQPPRAIAERARPTASADRHRTPYPLPPAVAGRRTD